MLTTTADRLRDDGGRVFGPYERGRMTVPVGDVGLDVANQGADRVERATPDGLAGEDPEPGFHQVEPGRALRGEGKMDRGMLVKPGTNRLRRMRGRVVEHDVQLVIAGAARRGLQEGEEGSH